MSFLNSNHVQERPQIWRFAPLFQENRSMLYEILAREKLAASEDLMNSVSNEQSQRKTVGVTLFGSSIRRKTCNKNIDTNALRRAHSISAISSSKLEAFHFLETGDDNKQQKTALFGSYKVPIIPWSDFSMKWIGDPLKPLLRKFYYVGGGKYGKVVVGKFVNNNRLCVVKQLLKPFDDKKQLDRDQVAMYQDEVGLMCRLNYTDVGPKIYGVSPLSNVARGDPIPDCSLIGDIVMEFIGDETTLKALTLSSLLAETDLLATIDTYCWLNMCAILCRKVQQLHQAHILSCDLKLDNVILKPIYRPGTKEIHHLIPYLIDFGLSVDYKLRTQCPPIDRNTMPRDEYFKLHPHVAPELWDMHRLPYSKQTDIFALGRIIRDVGLRTNIGVIYELGANIVETAYPNRPSPLVIANVLEDHMKSQRLLAAKENATLLQEKSPIMAFNLQQPAWRKWHRDAANGYKERIEKMKAEAQNKPLPFKKVPLKR